MNASSITPRPCFSLDTDAASLDESTFSEQLTDVKFELNRLEQNLWKETLQIAERKPAAGKVDETFKLWQKTFNETHARRLSECYQKISNLSKACAASSSRSTLQSNLTKIQKLWFKYFKTAHLFESLGALLSDKSLGTQLENHKRWTMACEAIMNSSWSRAKTKLTEIEKVINQAYATLKPTVAPTPETRELVSFFKACLTQLEKSGPDSRFQGLRSKLAELDAAQTQDVDDLEQLISQMSITGTDTEKQAYITTCLSSDTKDSTLMFAEQSWYISWPFIGYKPILTPIRPCQEAAKILRQLRNDIDVAIQLLLKGTYKTPSDLLKMQALYESVITDVEARLTKGSSELLQQISTQTHYGLNYISMLHAVLNDVQLQYSHFVRLCNADSQTSLWALQRAMQHTEEAAPCLQELYDLYLAAKAFASKSSTPVVSAPALKISFDEMQQKRVALAQQALAAQAKMILAITDADKKWYSLILSAPTPDRLQALLQEREEIETVVDRQPPKLQEELLVALIKPMIEFLYFSTAPSPEPFFSLVLCALEQDPQLAPSLLREQINQTFADIHREYKSYHKFQMDSDALNRCVRLSSLLDELEVLPFEKNINTASLYYQCRTLLSYIGPDSDESYMQLRTSLSERLEKFASHFAALPSPSYITTLCLALWPRNTAESIQTRIHATNKQPKPESPSPEETWLTQLWNATKFVEGGVQGDSQVLISLTQEYCTNKQTLHRQFGIFASECLLYSILKPTPERTDDWKSFMKLYAEYMDPSANAASRAAKRSEACALARSTTGDFDKKIISLGLQKMKPTGTSLSSPASSPTSSSSPAAAAAAAAVYAPTVSSASSHSTPLSTSATPIPPPPSSSYSGIPCFPSSSPLSSHNEPINIYGNGSLATQLHNARTFSAPPRYNTSSSSLSSQVDDIPE